MSGEPCVAGTRVPAGMVIAALTGGESHAEIHACYPSLPPGSIEAVLAWAKDHWVMEMAPGETAEEYAESLAAYRKLFEK